ncbi:Cell division control protein [Teratosphaeria destructans]|uniref:Cell division control protein n=1 Tax=Teratosphaeria destructans TaxID=418781 RepID=A0A9W7SJG6_9PEZI|nr:Cell division control protein [Teratosphaeria destructans]
MLSPDAALQHYRRATRRIPLLRRLSLTTAVLTLTWIYVLYWGERSTFKSHIDSCDWKRWEKWPKEAAPHRIVFISDPQLVDPHTYPGRPWPLSSLTETYTDRYMARSFRLINHELDPDSIVFLGDLFDGGREWAPSHARPLRPSQRKTLNEIIEGKTLGKRSRESYEKAKMRPHDRAIKKEDHFLDERGNDLKEFVYKEDGRWAKWDQQQWDAEYERFGRIFFERDQLYPQQNREILPAFEVAQDAVAMDNGAHNITTTEYAVTGGKVRRILSGLPGNHDIGLGMGVQLAVRDRFHMRFDGTNRVDVLGNHTFISIDSPSLSAFSQFIPEGGETPADRLPGLKHIWEPTMTFLENVREPANKAVADELRALYPDTFDHTRHAHAVVDPQVAAIASTDKKAKVPDVQLPVILLTHVPLYRDPDTDCGGNREGGKAITIRAGYQYQNVITRSLSGSLMGHVFSAGEVMHVFSGDDHDHCDVTHRYNIGLPGPDGNTRKAAIKSVPETTVKSFSWAMGVRRPGFQLLSLWNPVDERGKTVGTPLPTIQTQICLLPDQLDVFIDYALLLGATLAVLIVRAVVLSLRHERPGDDGTLTPPRFILPRYRPSKAKNTANGYATPTRTNSGKKGRQRASSTSTSNSHSSPQNANLSVQRSYTARTRAISPSPNSSAAPNGSENDGRPLIDKAGHYPSVRWTDPDDESEDEEKSVGIPAEDEKGGPDSQSKSRRSGKQTKVRTALGELGSSLLIVGLPSVIFYVWLIRNG